MKPGKLNNHNVSTYVFILLSLFFYSFLTLAQVSCPVVSNLFPENESLDSFYFYKITGSLVWLLGKEDDSFDNIVLSKLNDDVKKMLGEALKEEAPEEHVAGF